MIELTEREKECIRIAVEGLNFGVPLHYLIICAAKVMRLELGELCNCLDSMECEHGIAM